MSSVLGNTRNPDIRFYRSGRIDIFADLSIALGLEEGDIIDIWDEDGEQYLYIRHKHGTYIGRHDGVCHNEGRKNNHMRVWCTKISRYMLGLADAEQDVPLYAGIPVNHPRVGKAVPIITKHKLKS